MSSSNALGQQNSAICLIVIGERTEKLTGMRSGDASGEQKSAFCSIMIGERTGQPSSIERVIKIRTSCGLRQKESFVSSNFMLD